MGQGQTAPACRKCPICARRRAEPVPQPPRSLVDLPEAHLHLHFGGAIRPSTLAELCDRQRRPLPAIGGAMGTSAAFQEVYDAADRR